MAKKLNILIVGAHPDDCEVRAGGFAALCKKAGHRVRFMSLTNGCTGHHAMSGGELARRRLQESLNSAKVLGVECVIWDVQSNMLEANLFLRYRLIEEIRRFSADIVVSHRPNDYHPDHRYTGILVQDTSVSSHLPNVCPLTPYLKRPAAYLYLWDGFKHPNPFTADLIFSIDDVMDEKMQAIHCMTSQMYEWLPWESGDLKKVPKNEADRKKWLRQWRGMRDENLADRWRTKLVQKYGSAKGEKVEYAEAFEISEYGGGWLRKEFDRETMGLPCFPF